MKKRFCVFKLPTRLSDFLLKATLIQEKLLAPEFMSVMPRPEEVVPLLGQITVYYNQSQARDFSNVLERKQIEADVKEMMRKQLDYVNALAKGDDGMLSRSGFELNKEPTPRAIPPMGEVDNVVNRFDGDVIITGKRLANVERYQIEVEGRGRLLVSLESFTPKFKVPGLPSGTDLKVRMRAINRRGEGEWSPSVLFRVAGRTQLEETEV